MDISRSVLRTWFSIARSLILDIKAKREFICRSCLVSSLAPGSMRDIFAAEKQSRIATGISDFFSGQRQCLLFARSSVQLLLQFCTEGDAIEGGDHRLRLAFGVNLPIGHRDSGRLLPLPDRSGDMDFASGID
jgi:hypothetical protein